MDKLEVTKVQGFLGEELPLYTRLEAMSQGPRWLATLDTYMKTTLQTLMETCVQARLEDGATCGPRWWPFRDGWGGWVGISCNRNKVVGTA